MPTLARPGQTRHLNCASLKLFLGSVADTMESSQLTTEQTTKIRDAIGLTVGYLSRLVRRMERRGLPPDDMLFKLATEAYDKMYHLSIDLHYRSIQSGVGHPPRK